MPDTNIGSTEESNLDNSIAVFSFPSESLDGATGDSELSYLNGDWNKDFGYYLTVPEFKTAVDTKALWTAGGGYESDDSTIMLLDMIRGNGKDSFVDVLKNMVKIKTITGDSYSEVIRDKTGLLVNLKPLDPSTIKIVQSKAGRIVRYEQVTKSKTPNKRFKPESIFHLTHERIGDSIHGTRIISSLKWLIDARGEAMDDWRKVLRRNLRPMRIWYLDTDNEDEVSSFKRKTDSAYGNTENIYVPKGTVETEIASVAPNQTLNPLQWIEKLNDYFFQAVMVPQIIVGQGKEFTDASGKIVYLSYEQSVKSEQLYIENQVLIQLNLEIKLVKPASLQNELLSSNEKSPISGASEPNDQTVEMEGRK